jgi:transposase
MAQSDLAVGIDCGKRWLDGAMFPAGATRHVPNTPAGRQDLAIWIARHGAERVGLEASGGYEWPVRDALVVAGLAVHILNPARVRHFAKAKGQKAKTDPIDARIIAEFTACLVDTPPVIPDPARGELVGLVRTRRTLVDKHADLMKTCCNAPEVAGETIQLVLEALARAIADLEAAIESRVQTVPALKSTVERRRPLRASVRASVRSSPSAWRYWHRNWGIGPVGRSPPWPGWPRSPTIAESAPACATSPAGEPTCAGRCTWLQWSPQPAAKACWQPSTNA